MRLMTLSIIALWTASFGQAAEHKIAAELRNRAPDETVDVIVQFRHPPTDAQHQRMLYRGAHLKRSLDIIQAAHYSLSANQIAAISEDPDVEFISPDRPVYATAYTGNPDYGWRTVGADMATSVFNVDGNGIGVAVIDSGVNSHPDLGQSGSDNGHKSDGSGNSSRVVFQASLIPGLGPNDDYGHGTHVAGIIAGNGTESSGPQYSYLVHGIAPKVNIVSLRVLDANGVGTDSAVIYAIQTAIALKNQFNIRVINLSLGRPVATSYQLDPLCLAVQQAWQAGIVVVVAAGNSGRDNTLGTYGYGTITAPGNSPYVITVGAMNTVGTIARSDDKITSYSSKGPTAIDHIVKPDLVAPGNRIISLRDSGSTLDSMYPGNRVAAGVYSNGNNPNASDYYVLSGTSMAAPMVSGAAVLLIAQNPAVTPRPDQSAVDEDRR